MGRGESSAGIFTRRGVTCVLGAPAIAGAANGAFCGAVKGVTPGGDDVPPAAAA